MSRHRSLLIPVILLFILSPVLAHEVDSPVEETTPVVVLQNTAVFLNLALVLGGAGFGLFVWKPAQGNNVPRSFRMLWGVLVVGGAALFWFSLYRQPPAVGDPLLAALMRWLHLVMALLWGGGIIFFLIAIWREETSRARLITHFVGYSRLCVAVIALTGIYGAWLNISSIEGLLTTAYGQALIVKTLFFAVAVQLMLTGRIRKNILAAAVVLVIGVLAGTGVLRSVDSARAIVDWRIDQELHLNDPAVYEARLVEDLQIDFSVLPGSAGANTVYVTLFDSMNGLRLDTVSTVRVLLNSTIQETIELVLESQGDGVYSAPTQAMSVEGDWNAQVVVGFPDRGGATASYDFRITEPLIVASEPVSPVLQIVIGVVAGLLLIGVSGVTILQKRAAPVTLAWVSAVVGVAMAVGTIVSNL
jgi:hypothetical protein